MEEIIITGMVKIKYHCVYIIIFFDYIGAWN